jgi:hypothetical protein
MNQIHPSQSLDVINFEHSLDAKRANRDQMARQAKVGADGNQGWLTRAQDRLLQSIHLCSEFFKSRYGSGQENIENPAQH